MTRNGYVGLQSADLIRTYQLPSNRRLRSNLRSTRVVLGHTQWVHLILQSHLGEVPTGPIVALTGPVLVPAAPF